MWVARPPKVIREGEELLKDLDKKGIKDHLALNSYPELKAKVMTFLEDVKKAIVWVQDEIAKFVHETTGDVEDDVKRLEIQQTNLVNVQGRVLQLVRQKR